MPVSRSLFLSVLCLGALTACRDSKIATYRVPKEKDDPPAAAPASLESTNAPVAGTMAGTAVPTDTSASLKWTAPAHWQPGAPSTTRKGSYIVPGDSGAPGDLSITAFPGDVGGELANINRWRGQVQLAAITQADLAAAVTRIEQNGLKFAIVDFGDDKVATGQRVLGAIVPYGGSTWFFKLSGPDALIKKEKPAFLDFLKTVKAP